MESVSMRNPTPQHRSQCESSLEHGFYDQYSDGGQMQLPYDMSSPSSSNPSSWTNQPPADPLFGMTSNTAGLRQSVRPILGIVPSGSNPQAGQGSGSGRFLHTPSAAIYYPPEPRSPSPNPSALLRAAFQSANNRLEYQQVTPPRFSFQTPVATPSAAPIAENWNTTLPASGSNCGYGGDKPQSQPDNGGAPAPPEELLPSLNLSREEYQHWMDSYDKACKARDETSIVWCRHYWYVAVYLPSVAPPADVLSTPDPLFL